MAIDIQLIRNSADQIRLSSAVLRQRFYEILFEEHPELESVVSSKDKLMLGELFDRALGALVSEFDQPEALERQLLELGHRYRKTSLNPEHFSILGETLLQSLSEILANSWTRQLEKALDEVIGLTFAIMGRAVAAAKSPVR